MAKPVLDAKVLPNSVILLAKILAKLVLFSAKFTAKTTTFAQNRTLFGSANLPKSSAELLGGYAGAKSADFAGNGAIKNSTHAWFVSNERCTHFSRRFICQLELDAHLIDQKLRQYFYPTGTAEAQDTLKSISFSISFAVKTKKPGRNRLILMIL